MFLWAFFLSGCTSIQFGAEDVAKQAALLAARPILEKIFFAEAPLAPSSRELYPIVKQLPGQLFDPRQYSGNQVNLRNGVLTLSPGDYIVPLMTYCMQSAGSSPTAHQYRLSKLSGKQASAIRDLNARLLSQFKPRDIQVLSWSIQNGIPYEEMSAKSKEIVAKVIPEHRAELKLSFYQSFIDKWNGIAVKTGLPHFNELTDDALNSLGTFGESIKGIRSFRKKLLERGYEYEELSSLISLPGPSLQKGTEETTPWSQISENVYARFITTGHYLDVGELQVRVMGKARFPQAIKSNLSVIDVSSLIADPGAAGIQPLSFTPLQGAIAIPFLVEGSPTIVSVFLAALIAAQYTDWEAVSAALDQFGGAAHQNVQALIEKLRQMYTKEFGSKSGQVVHPPAIPEAFPNLERVKRKTDRLGGGKRPRWKDKDGNIYEWDYQHGHLEKYDKRGIHQGEYDPKTGQQTKPKDPTRRVEP